MGKCPNGAPLDNIGEYKTILVNTWQCQLVFDNTGHYLNVPNNITSQTIVTRTILNTTGQIFTTFSNIVQYFAILDNIGVYQIILDNTVSIVQYLNVPNNVTTQTKESRISLLNDIEKYWTILGNIGQYLTLLYNIGVYRLVTFNI